MELYSRQKCVGQFAGALAPSGGKRGTNWRQLFHAPIGAKLRFIPDALLMSNSYFGLNSCFPAVFLASPQSLMA